MKQSDGGLSIGDRAPDFELESDTGESVRLSSFRNQAHVVLLFVREFT